MIFLEKFDYTAKQLYNVMNKHRQGNNINTGDTFMDVFLTTLNIMGIILIALLCIMLFLLFVLAYIICMPFYYNVAVSHHAKTEFKFKISSFFRGIVISGDSRRESPVTLRILWIFRKKFDFGGKKPTVPPAKPHAKPPSSSDKEAEASPKSDEESEKSPGRNSEEKISGSEKRKIKKQKRAEIWSKVKSIWSTVKRIKSYPHKKAILKATLNLLKEVINAIKPKRLKIRCLLGLSNPFDTGIALAAISTVKPFVKADQILVEADFENETFEIDIDAKGWFNLLSILLPVIRYIRTKPVWVIVKHVIKRG